jgi:ketosteroid isomerase-like protein
VAALLALSLLALGSCDGDDGDPKQVVRDFVKATNERDSDRLCDDLLSAEFIAQSTGAKEGDTEACKEQLEAVTGLRLSLVEVRGSEVDGDDATVTAILRVQGQRQRRVFRLEKQDGDWKLAGGSSR